MKNFIFRVVIEFEFCHYFFGMVKKSKSKCVVLKKLQNYFLLHFKNIRLSRITLIKREFTTIFKLRTKYLRMG